MTRQELKNIIRESIREELNIHGYLNESTKDSLKAPINKYTSFSFDEVATKVAGEIFENSEFKKMLNSSIDSNLVVYDDDVAEMIEDALLSLGVSSNNMETVTSMVCGKLDKMTDKISNQINTSSEVKTKINKSGNISGKRVG